MSISLSIINRFSCFVQDISKSCHTIGEKIVKLYAELQKLDQNMTSLYRKPITLILDFYYMSNGLTFEISNIILRNFY